MWPARGLISAPTLVFPKIGFAFLAAKYLSEQMIRIGDLTDDRGCAPAARPRYNSAQEGTFAAPPLALPLSNEGLIARPAAHFISRRRIIAQMMPPELFSTR